MTLSSKKQIISNDKGSLMAVNSRSNSDEARHKNKSVKESIAAVFHGRVATNTAVLFQDTTFAEISQRK